jgi:dienelactone hydrolase
MKTIYIYLYIYILSQDVLSSYRLFSLAVEGYVAFAADVYGADMQFVESFDDRIAAVTKYRTDPELFFSRIQDAIDQVKLLTDDVNSEEIAIIGYCFGGSAVVLYSLSGGTDAKVGHCSAGFWFYHGSSCASLTWQFSSTACCSFPWRTR